MTELDNAKIALSFEALQDDICSALENLDGKAQFQEDSWKRDGGGGGRTRVIEKGNIIEKGGVNFSAVYGATPEKISHALGLKGADFYATGVSIVLHPSNPHVPIIHMNVRYFEMSDGTWWFGGGIDLTPHYVVPEDATFFHQELKTTCDKHSEFYYQKFKKWADDYFFIKHRNETRGIGGIFFDRLSEEPSFSKTNRFDFVLDIGKSFAPIYSKIAKNNVQKPFGQREKDWQLLRRGRYVEFNLVYDKGTKFGLDTDGRTESILMSLPPVAEWKYDHQMDEGTAEAESQALLRKGINWA